MGDGGVLVDGGEVSNIQSGQLTTEYQPQPLLLLLDTSHQMAHNQVRDGGAHRLEVLGAQVHGLGVDGGAPLLLHHLPTRLKEEAAVKDQTILVQHPLQASSKSVMKHHTCAFCPAYSTYSFKSSLSRHQDIVR